MRTTSTPASVFGELMQGDRNTNRRVQRSGLADTGGGRFGEVAHAAALGDVRGLRVAAVPRAGGEEGERLARERGASPLDVLCTMAVAEDLTTRFRAYIANDDVERLAGFSPWSTSSRPVGRRRPRRPAV